MKLKILAFLLALTLCLGATASADTGRINWHYKSKQDNSRPEILGGQNIPLGNSLYIGNEGDKTVYLTFDAGYGNENLSKILDVLKTHDIKAAFFILPGIIKNSQETVQRMIDDGHLLCNHSTSHGDMSKITDIKVFERELSDVETLFYNTYGVEMCKYFRPPEGAFNSRTLEFCAELGYTPVFWSFAYADWDNAKQPNPEKAKQKILSQLHDGCVFLFHPTSKTNADILDDVICEIESRGYSFGTLDELKNSIAQ